MSYYFNVPKLIQCIAKRPQIWNQQHVDYKNKRERCSAWEEVAVEMIEEWPTLESNKLRQNARLKELQNKWRHVRDLFVKYNKHKKNNPRKKYVYNDLLQFLLANKKSTRSTVDDRNKEENSPETISTGEINIKNEYYVNHDSNDPYFGESSQSNQTRFLPVQDEQENGTSIQVTKSKNAHSTAGGSRKRPFARDEDSDTDDPDKMFLLSMVPMFKKLDDEKKMTARIQLTQVLQRLLYPKI